MIHKADLTATQISYSIFQKTALLILCILIPLSVGGLSSGLTSENLSILDSLKRPPLYPPGFLFPIVWTILYILMGIASYIVLMAEAETNDIVDAISAYLLQLIVNFFWPIFFFNLQAYLFSFFWLVLLWILIALSTYNFAQLSKPASYLMLPYLIWVSFAGYLNLGIYLLN